MKHQEGCGGAECGPIRDGPFEEALFHNYVLNVPFNPMDDEHEIYMPLSEDRGLRLYDDGFWICHEKKAYFIDRRSDAVRSRHEAMSASYKYDRQEMFRKRNSGGLVRRMLRYTLDRIFGY